MRRPCASVIGQVGWRTKAILTATQEIASGAETAVDWDGTDVIDDLGWHDPSSNPSRITIDRAVPLCLVTSVGFAANGTGIRQAIIKKNGTTEMAKGSAPGHASQESHCNVVCYDAAAKDDYYEVLVYQDGGTGVNVLQEGDVFFEAITV